MRLPLRLAVTLDLHHGARLRCRDSFTDFYFALQVRKTQAAIKHALTERFYAWEDAWKLADQDPEVDLSGVGPAYTPSGSHLESEEAALEEEPEGQGAAGGRPEAAEDSKPSGAKPSEEAIDPSTIPNPEKGQADAPRV